jgi:DNA-binding response OmpR family regulator
MPDQDGIEVVMAVRRDAPTARIIAFSGGTGGLDCLESAKLLGAHRTMRKPVAMAEVLQAVQEELRRGSSANGSSP